MSLILPLDCDFEDAILMGVGVSSACLVWCWYANQVGTGGIYKCKTMGLVPMGTGDWLQFETRADVSTIPPFPLLGSCHAMPSIAGWQFVRKADGVATMLLDKQPPEWSAVRLNALGRG